MVTRPKQLHGGCGGHPCLDFVNSAGRPAGTPPTEHLHDYADLTLWSAQAGTIPERRAKALARAGRRMPRAAAAILERARVLREAAFRTFLAIVKGRKPARADLATINAELSSALAHARVAPARRPSGGFVWAWSQESDSAEALEEPLWPIARSAAELLVSPDRELVKECASDDCLWLFLDRTRNHKRRWCEMKTCGNRAKVREHRRRSRALSDRPEH